jgi:ABC-type uncharacterized transport system permease subunit
VFSNLKPNWYALSMGTGIITVGAGTILLGRDVLGLRPPSAPGD